MSKQVYTVGAIEAKEGKFDELKQIVAELAVKTREEEGNIEYIILEDTLKPNTLFSIEKWETAEAEEKHWEMPHLKEAFSKLQDLLVGEPQMNKGFEV